MLLYAATLYGQNEVPLPKPKRLISQIEFFGGPNASNFWGNSTISDQVINIRYTIGAGVSHELTPTLALNAKMLWENKGDKTDRIMTFYDENNQPITSRFVQGNRLEYITLSVSLKSYVGRQHKFFGAIGPAVGYLIKQGTYTKEYDLDGNQISFYQSNIDAYRDFDVGLTGIFGFNHPLNDKINFTAQIFGNLGLSNIWPDDFPADGSLRNYSISLLVGITLNKK